MLKLHKSLLPVITVILLLIFILILAGSPTCAQNASSGILLGLRYEKIVKPSGDNHENSIVSAYRSLWIYPSAVGFEVIQDPSLIVHSPHGFREIGIWRYTEGRITEDIFYAVPLGKKYQVKTTHDPDVDTAFMNKTILFAGSDFATVETASYGYSRGAAHPWAFNLLETFSLENPVKPVQIQHFFGSQGLDHLQDEATRYLRRHPEKADELSPEADPAGWGITRRSGEWVIQGMLRYNNEVNRGAFAYYDVTLRPPAKLVGSGFLKPSWNTIKSNVPTAYDAFSSPSGDILGILTPRELFLYKVNGDIINFYRPTKTIPLKTAETIVSLHYAEGATVNKWTEQLKKVMK